MTAPNAPSGLQLRYPLGAVSADLARAAAGVVAAGAPLVAAHPPPWLAGLLGVVLLLFGAFLLAAIRRARRVLRLDQDGLWVAPGNVRLRFDALRSLRLDYYSTRRDGRDGWLELRLADGERTLRVDSRLLGFDELLTRAARAAGQLGLALAPATIANLQALGHRAGTLSR